MSYAPESAVGRSGRSSHGSTAFSSGLASSGSTEPLGTSPRSGEVDVPAQLARVDMDDRPCVGAGRDQVADFRRRARGQFERPAVLPVHRVRPAPWILFDHSLLFVTRSIERNRKLIAKVYFPRLILPLSRCRPGCCTWPSCSSYILTVFYHRCQTASGTSRCVPSCWWRSWRCWSR